MFDLLFKESGHLRCGGGEKPDFLQERLENYLMSHYITLHNPFAVHCSLEGTLETKRLSPNPLTGYKFLYSNGIATTLDFKLVLAWMPSIY